MKNTFDRPARFALVCLFAATLSLRVDPGSAAASSPTNPAATLAAQDQLTEAERHFRRGVDLYEDGDMSGSFVEFTRAYEIVPSYRILYNLAQVAYRRQDYVRALDTFRKYLAEGRDFISGERRRQIEQDIRRLDQRIGRIEIDADKDDDGAEIRIDDLQIGTMPLLESIATNVGARKIEMVRPGGERQVRIVDVAGGETVRIHFARTALRLSPDLNTLARAHSSDAPAHSLLSETSPRRVSVTPPRGTWLAWSITGLLAAGASVTGVLAFTESRDLQQRRDSFPLIPGELDPIGHRARAMAITTDVLLAGAAVMTALSVYLTVRTSPDAEPVRNGLMGMSSKRPRDDRRGEQ